MVPKRRSAHTLRAAVSVVIWLAADRGFGAAKVCPPTAAHIESVRLAVTDLMEAFGGRYPRGRTYLARLRELSGAARAGQADAVRQLWRLRRRALLDNPLLDFDKLVLLKRRRGQLGLPVNHKCNAGIKQSGYDNEIAVLSGIRSGAKLATLFRPTGRRFVGEIDLHYDGDRMLLTMPVGGSWQIFELKIDPRAAKRLRQVSRGQGGDVDNFDACYLPDGRIVYASTASYTAVPCWHGKERACNLYIMNADPGAPGRIRQVCFDQDLDLHPAVLPTGQVIFSRWDYTGTMHMYLRPLMAMNPDGTGQRAVYGSNSYWPNALYFPRGIPGSPDKIVAIVAGYHGVPRMGELALIDTSKGWHEADGVVQRIPGRGKRVKTVIRDRLVDGSWPKFLHPYPLSDPSTGLGAGKYFLVAAQVSRKSSWGIYLVDVFDNVLPVLLDAKYDFFEPIPLRATPRPPVIPDRVDLTRDDAVVYLHNVYAGPGLAGVPRNTVKRLRVVAYHFGYPGMAGPDKIGSGGPWEVMRILGTVPVHPDGSAAFRVPANTPLCVQPLDAEGKAVQLMRSWFTAMPGEVVSCVGCHEQPKDAAAARRGQAVSYPPVAISPWYGPPRGLDFERDVQPALDKYCVGCHNGRPRPGGGRIPDLRGGREVKGYRGRPLSRLGAQRLHPAVRKHLGGTSVRYTPAYEALVPYIRRVNVEDDVHMLVPGEYHADTSELIQKLRKGHHNVRPDREAWDRLVTWIDLNGPCHGTWGDISPVPEGAARRRRELCRLYGGPTADLEAASPVARAPVQPIVPKAPPKNRRPAPMVPGWPFDATEARRRQAVAGKPDRTIDMGGGVTMKLVWIPAGQFVMGDADGVAVRDGFWMGAHEVTNEQFHRFDPAHDSGYFTKRYKGMDGPGLSLTGAKQPAVRVAWTQAAGFGRWLSAKAGLNVVLPTQVQWEYACRAGSAEALHYGGLEANFSQHANVADASLARRPGPTGGLRSNVTYPVKGILLSAVVGGNILCDARFDDKCVGTAEVGRYKPNAWGLHDMHGNAAEWTRSTHRSGGCADRKVIRGGSWVDRPKRCRSAFRLSYPPWQRVHNVGFRVICEAPRR